MKYISIVLVFMVATIFTSALYAESCNVDIGIGIEFVDSDCDDVADPEQPKLPDDYVGDNCPFAENGDCNANPDKCNIDDSKDESGKPTLSKEEDSAGYQADWDKNGVGNACDDYDKDGTLDYLDTCKSVYNPNQDPAYCTDTDNDGFEDKIDNCLSMYNPTQIDSDVDNIGDWCDNCRLVYNPDQKDNDLDGVGNACPKTAPKTPDAYVGVPENVDTYQFGADRQRGGGGCSLAAGTAPSNMIGLILLLLSSCVVSISKKVF